MKTIHVIIEQTNTGYCAYSEDVLGCISTAETIEEIKISMAEAISFHLDGLIEDGDEVPSKLNGDYTLDFKLKI